MNINVSSQKSPASTKVLPPGIVEYLSGDKLDQRVGEAVCVTTVDEDGWPHTSLLSVGEILALDAEHMRLATWKHSGTAKNIHHSGRVSLVLAHDNALWEVLLKAKPLTAVGGDLELTYFAAEVKKVRAHRVDYADVLTGVTYRLPDQAGAVLRWELQIQTLRAAKAA